MEKLSYEGHGTIRFIVGIIAFTIIFCLSFSKGCEYDYKTRNLELQRQKAMIEKNIIPQKRGLGPCQ